MSSFYEFNSQKQITLRKVQEIRNKNINNPGLVK